MSKTNTKHTPGPWTIIPAAREGHAHMIEEPGGLRFISIGARNNWTEQEANARLIAAAPRTAAALRALLEWGRNHTSPTKANSPHALLVEAEGALAEVEGA
ncbi:MAG: hypothetical protein ACOYMV_08080 [Verrucomicrobiia bacterium]